MREAKRVKLVVFPEGKNGQRIHLPLFPGTKWTNVPGTSTWKTVLQGKTSSDLKVIQSKVLTEGSLSSSGPVSWSYYLAERRSWCPWNQTFQALATGFYANVLGSGLTSLCRENLRIILAGGSPCSCLSRFPACRRVKQLLLFNSTCLCCSWNYKVSGQTSYGLLWWFFDVHL